MIKTPEASEQQAFGIFETVGSKISHGTSKKFHDVRNYLRKVSKENLIFHLRGRKASILIESRQR